MIWRATFADPPGPLTVSVTVYVPLSKPSQAPPGGFVLAWPGSRPPGDTRVNGRVVHWHGEELRFHDVPATVTVRAEP